MGTNSGSGSTTNAAYRVDTSIGSGYHPTDTFTIDGNQTFTFTGATQTYTVPDG